MKGFTLIELILSVAILASFLGLGIPKIYQQLDRHQCHTDVLTLQNTLMYARGLAQKRGESITVCPSNTNTCSNNWLLPVVVFNDKNFNQVIDPQEQLMHTTHLNSDAGYWQKSKQQQNYIRFNHLGHAFSSASTLLFCPNSKNNHLAKSLVINFQGRIRSGNYLNKQGTPYSKFSQLNCE